MADAKGKRITDVAIAELSLIFNEHKGERWQPVNGEARVLAVKGAPEAPKPEKSLAAKAFETLKAYFTGTDDSVANTWPVTQDVPDNIDGDGDGAEDYSAYALAICGAANDVQNAMCMGDPARSAAIVAVIDTFRAEAKAMFGISEKAGRRTSAADKQHLDAMASAHKTMGEHLAALTDTEDLADGGADEDTEKGQADDLTEDGVLIEKADKEPYGDVPYADPGYQDDKKKRYPLDTEKHIRAAASYFGKQKNRDKYSADQQKEIDDRIAAAEKEHGIGDQKGSVEPSESPEAQITQAVERAVAAKAVALESEFSAKAKALESETATLIEKAQSELTAAKTEIAALTKELVQKARKPSSPGFVPTLDDSGQFNDPVAAVTRSEKGSAAPSSIFEAVRLRNSG